MNMDRPTQNKVNTYIRTVLTESYLSSINEQIHNINNLVIGENNKIEEGNANFIIGDNNLVKGSENWIFTQGFNGAANKDLILDHWLIDIAKTNEIVKDPKKAISKW